MSTEDQILSSELHGEALLTARRPELQPLIDHLREVAQGRDDIRIECAGILAGSWFSSAGGASPPRHRALPRQHGLGLRPVRLLGVTGDMWEDHVDVDGEIIYDIGEDIAKKIGELSRTEAIRNQVQQAHLDRNVVCNAIDDKIKKSIAALDDTPQDHAGSDA